MTQPPAHTPLLVSGHIIVSLCAAVNRQVGRFSLSGQGWDRVAHLASLPSLIHSPDVSALWPPGVLGWQPELRLCPVVPEVASLKEHPLWSPQRPGTRPAALAE